MKNKLFLSFLTVLLLSPMTLWAAASDDNEVHLDQTGDTLSLTIDQVGYGNKFGLNNFATSAAKMPVTGTSLTFNIDQLGNENLLFGTLEADSSSYTLEFNGDSNSFDWLIGDTGSSDTSNFAIDVTGDSNTWDLDQGSVASAERLDLDLILIGNSNVFDIDFESDDITWDWEITGDSNNINTLQTDGGDHIIEADFVGDSADIDITQNSGTCPQGISSCSAIVKLDITSDNAVIQITQSDTSD